MTYTYTPKGVCSRLIQIETDGDKIVSVKFQGGCNGNTQGISHLIVGMDIHDAINRLSGIDCKGRGTSCPDQLSIDLKEALSNEQDS